MTALASGVDLLLAGVMTVCLAGIIEMAVRTEGLIASPAPGKCRQRTGPTGQKTRSVAGDGGKRVPWNVCSSAVPRSIAPSIRIFSSVFSGRWRGGEMRIFNFGLGGYDRHWDRSRCWVSEMKYHQVDDVGVSRRPDRMIALSSK